MLLLHPEVETKLLQEVEQVLGTTTTAAPDAKGAASEPASPSSSSSCSSTPTCRVNVVIPDGGLSKGEWRSSSSNSSGGGGGSAVKPSYDQLRQLKYARAVFLEGLRLYPSVPAVRGGREDVQGWSFV